MESGSFSGNTQSNESEQPNIPEPNQNIYAHLMSIDRAQLNFQLQIAQKDSEIATLKMELAETKLEKVIPYQTEIFNELGHIKDLISNNLQGQTNEPVMNLDKFKELFNIETKQIEEKCNTRIQEIVFSQNASLEELRQEFIEKEKNLSLKFCNLLDERFERIQEKDARILELENRMLRLETGLVEIQKQNISNNVPESPKSIKPTTSRKDSVPDRISNFENSMNNKSYLINSSIDVDSEMLPEGNLVIDESQGSNNSSQEAQLQAVSEPGPQVQKLSSFSISPASPTLSTTRSKLSNSQANSLMPPPVTPHVQLTSVHDKTKVHENIYTPKKNNDQLQKLQSQPSSTSSKTSFNFAKDLNVPYDPKVSKQNKYWNDSPRPNSQSSTFQFGKDLQKRTRDNIIQSGSESSLSSDTSHFKRQNSLSFPTNQPQIQKSSNINFKTSQLNLLNTSSTELPSNFNQYNSFMGSQNRKSQNRKSKDSGNFISMDDLEDC